MCIFYNLPMLKKFNTCSHNFDDAYFTDETNKRNMAIDNMTDLSKIPNIKKCFRKGYFKKGANWYCKDHKKQGDIFDLDLLSVGTVTNLIDMNTCGEPLIDLSKKLPDMIAKKAIQGKSINEKDFLKIYYEGNIIFTYFIQPLYGVLLEKDCNPSQSESCNLPIKIVDESLQDLFNPTILEVGNRVSEAGSGNYPLYHENSETYPIFTDREQQKLTTSDFGRLIDNYYKFEEYFENKKKYQNAPVQYIPLQYANNQQIPVQQVPVQYMPVQQMQYQQMPIIQQPPTVQYVLRKPNTYQVKYTN